MHTCGLPKRVFGDTISNKFSDLYWITEAIAETESLWILEQQKLGQKFLEPKRDEHDKLVSVVD